MVAIARSGVLQIILLESAAAAGVYVYERNICSSERIFNGLAPVDDMRIPSRAAARSLFPA